MSRLTLSDWYGWINSTASRNEGQRNRRFYEKGQHIYWVDWLIWLNHLSYSCELIESVDMSLVTWLNWLTYSSYTDSWWLNQYIFTFYHDWIDCFGISRIQFWFEFNIWPSYEWSKVRFSPNPHFSTLQAYLCLKNYEP